MITITDSIEKVKKIINDFTTEGGDATDDQFTIDNDEIIKIFVVSAANQIVHNVPPSLVAVTQAVGYNNKKIVKRPDGKYYIIINDIPFRKLLMVQAEVQRTIGEGDNAEQVAEWKRPVTTFHSFDSQLYRAQFTDIKGIGNGPDNPAVFITMGSAVTSQSDVCPTIELHAFNEKMNIDNGVTEPDEPVSGDDATPAVYLKIMYIPSKLIKNDNETLLISSTLSDALCYLAAALYMQSIPDERAQSLMATASSILQSFNSSTQPTQ